MRLINVRCLFTLLPFPRDKIIIPSFRSSLVHGSPSVSVVAAASMCRQGSQSGHGSGSTQKSPSCAGTAEEEARGSQEGSGVAPRGTKGLQAASS